MTPEAAATLDALIQQTEDFLAGPSRFPSISLMLYGDHHRVYLRKGHVAFRDVMLPNSFCIANIEFEEDVQGQGVFTAYLDRVLGRAPAFELVVVECVNNPALEPLLLRQGFERDPIRTTNFGRMKPGFTAAP